MEIAGGEQEGCQYLIGVYIQETAQKLAHLKLAIAKNLMEEVKSIAHGCAGSAASYGILSMVPLMRQLEQMAEKNDLNGLRPLHEEAERRFARIEVQLKNFRLPA